LSVNVVLLDIITSNQDISVCTTNWVISMFFEPPNWFILLNRSEQMGITNILRWDIIKQYVNILHMSLLWIWNKQIWYFHICQSQIHMWWLGNRVVLRNPSWIPNWDTSSCSYAPLKTVPDNILNAAKTLPNITRIMTCSCGKIITIWEISNFQ